MKPTGRTSKRGKRLSGDDRRVISNAGLGRGHRQGPGPETAETTNGIDPGRTDLAVQTTPPGTKFSPLRHLGTSPLRPGPLVPWDMTHSHPNGPHQRLLGVMGGNLVSSRLLVPHSPLRLSSAHLAINGVDRPHRHSQFLKRCLPPSVTFSFSSFFSGRVSLREVHVGHQWVAGWPGG